jgi:hypothetical protein
VQVDPFGGTRLEERQQSLGLAHRGIEPERVVGRREDRRHPVVDRGDAFVRVGRDDRARVEFVRRGLAVLEDRSHREQRTAAHAQREGTRAAAAVLPLVEAVCRHESTPMCEGVAEERTRRHRLGSRVDRAPSRAHVLREARHEAPAARFEHALASVSGAHPHDRDGLARRDVETRGQHRFAGEIEMARDLRARLREKEAPAHRAGQRSPRGRRR